MPPPVSDLELLLHVRPSHLRQRLGGGEFAIQTWNADLGLAMTIPPSSAPLFTLSDWRAESSRGYTAPPDCGAIGAEIVRTTAKIHHVYRRRSKHSNAPRPFDSTPSSSTLSGTVCASPALETSATGIYPLKQLLPPNQSPETILDRNIDRWLGARIDNSTITGDVTDYHHRVWKVTKRIQATSKMSL